jgi:hypothetical protein
MADLLDLALMKITKKHSKYNPVQKSRQYDNDNTGYIKFSNIDNKKMWIF